MYDTNQAAPAFARAFALRREISQLLDQQQAEDSICGDKLRATIVSGSRAVLSAVADWLFSLEPNAQVSLEERTLFSKVSPTMSVEAWLTLRREIERLRSQYQHDSANLKAAQDLYDSATPFGLTIKRAFSDAGEIVKAERLQKELQSAKDAKDKSERSLKSSLAELEQCCERFLRAAMQKDSMILLVDPRSGKLQIRKAISQLGDALKLIWEKSRGSQQNSCERLDQKLAELKNLSLG